MKKDGEFLKMKKIFFALVGLVLAFSASAAPYSEGQQYSAIKQTVAGQPEVVEFFSFFCPHCYQFEHVWHVSAEVKKELPANTKYVKYHVDFLGGDFAPAVSQAWAVAVALGVEDKVSDAIFDGIQKTQTITDPASLKATFVKAAGITPEAYDAAWNSFAVKAFVAQQQKAAADFQIQGVPAVYVNGKYLINNGGLDTSSMENYKLDYANAVKFLVNKK